MLIITVWIVTMISVSVIEKTVSVASGYNMIKEVCVMLVVVVLGVNLHYCLLLVVVVKQWVQRGDYCIFYS